MPAQSDVGMQVKMNEKCFAGIRDLDRGERIDETPILALCDFIDARHDCADFRMICVIKTYLSYLPLLSETTAARIVATILHFKYAMDEPGADGMCYWSENHQLLFAACDYLAGGLFPDRIFTNDGKSGTLHRDKARILLERWMHYRFRYGFNEFHSNTYYEEDVAPLSVLADFAEEALRIRAAIILDLLFLDMVHHSFRGAFVAASGRCYEAQKRDAGSADVNDLLHAAFGFGNDEPDWTRISALYLLCRTYRVPAVIRAIALEQGPMIVRDSMGMNLSEVKRELGNHAFDDLGLYYWAMEAFTNRESIGITMDMFDAWHLAENNFLRDLRRVNIPILKRLGLLPLLVGILNPATQGVAIERANTYTYKTKEYLLSTAQEYRPYAFGDQQHLWQATLPGGTNVFSTHPGSPMFDDPARNFSPSYWVGNGINPHVAQERNVVLLSYDLRGRKGYLERRRQKLVHFHFPAGKFDEIVRTPFAVCGRVGEAYVAIRSDVPCTSHDAVELVYRGRRMHFAVVLGAAATHGGFAAFTEAVQTATMTVRGGSFAFGYDHRYELVRRRGLIVDGTPIATDYPRFETPFVMAPRRPERLEIHHDEERLILDFENGIRTETPSAEASHG